MKAPSIELKMLDDKEMLNRVLKQLKNEFCRAGIEMSSHESNQHEFEVTQLEIRSVLEKLLAENQKKLMQILYQMDIPEGLFNEAMKSNQAAKNITELIIKRALQKVVLRTYYSS